MSKIPHIAWRRDLLGINQHAVGEKMTLTKLLEAEAQDGRRQVSQSEFKVREKEDVESAITPTFSFSSTQIITHSHTP